MARGEFKIAKQIGPKGYFGKVVLHVEPGEDGQIEVDFDEERAIKWKSGVRFGIDYVLDHLPEASLPNGLKIHLELIDGIVVDTTTTLIAYVTAIALIRALGSESTETPLFDDSVGAVVFP